LDRYCNAVHVVVVAVAVVAGSGRLGLCAAARRCLLSIDVSSFTATTIMVNTVTT
jgi:hypothetical protein